MRALAIIAVVILGIFALTIVSPFIMDYSISSQLPDGGDEITNLDTDIQGIVSNFSPKNEGNSIPLRAKFVGDEGDNGHVAWAVNDIQSRFERTDTVGIDLTLNDIELQNDGAMNRIGVATAWLVDGKRYYLEFDIWDSALTQPLLTNLIHYDPSPDSEMPTIIVQMDQMEIGQRKGYTIDVVEQFENFWPNLEAQLDAVYLVIEKASSSSTFYADITINELRLY